MPRRGENIHKRKDGRWEGRCKIPGREENSFTVKSVYAHSYAEVKRKLTDLKDAIELACLEEISPTSITFDMAAKQWLATIHGTKKYSTYTKYRNIYNTHLKEEIGGVTLCSLNASDFEPIILKRGTNGEGTEILSESLEKSIYSVVNQVMLYGRQNYHLNLNQFSREKRNKHRKPVEIFNDTEQQRLVRYLDQDMDLYKLGILICLYTGLRIGELCSLKWEDIDFVNKIIRVNSTVQRLPASDLDNPQRTCLMESEPKSYFSRREIPISENLFQRLNSFPQHGKYVVGIDRVMDPRSYQKKFRFYLEEAGIPYKSFHTLRHTFATNCVSKGSDAKSLSEMLGHSDVKTTLNRYVHPSMDTKRAYLNLLYPNSGQKTGQEPENHRAHFDSASIHLSVVQSHDVAK